MKNVIPFTKELEFDTKVSEITSISLEREFNVKDETIEGNLLINGEYKSHEVSVNILPFDFKIPFSISIPSNTILDTISLEISDFAYDIIDDNKIKVHIELELFFNEDEEERNIDIDDSQEIMSLIEENLNEQEEVPIEEPKIEEPKEEPKIEPKVEEETIVTNENILETKDEYMTYHIHIVKENETIETICAQYNVTESFLKEYNDINSLNVNDKILIPFENE